ncbi:hypothetical protein KM043_015614 [Ampulex compressa]|nr:hypothetical protein KM043_015614 [Ampulex compressa]
MQLDAPTHRVGEGSHVKREGCALRWVQKRARKGTVRRETTVNPRCWVGGYCTDMRPNIALTQVDQYSSKAPSAQHAGSRQAERAYISSRDEVLGHRENSGFSQEPFSNHA